MIIKYRQDETKKFSEIKNGSTFIYNKMLYIKGTQCSNINAMCLDTSDFEFFHKDTDVYHVESEIYISQGLQNDC